MLVVLRPEAELELLDAQAWYESKALGLGFEFARAADAAVASALRNPFGHFRIEEEFRRVLFRKFPYTLIYLPSSLSDLKEISCKSGWPVHILPSPSRIFASILQVRQAASVITCRRSVW